MSRVKLKFAELHAPLFLHSEKGGKNMTSKLDATKVAGLVIEYDREEKELHVSWGGMSTFLPSTAVQSMVPLEGKKMPESPNPVGDTTQRNPPPSAQVSTPFGHVFAGPGAGQTGQEAWQTKPGPDNAKQRAEATETVVRRGPGRPPKS